MSEKAVLISMNKPHTDNIFTHKKKKVEWRKKPLPLTTNYCYETKNKGGCGKVIGQFDVVQNVEFDPLNHRLYSLDFIEDGCVPIEDLIEYANGDVIWGNVLENIERYDKPCELSEFKQVRKISRYHKKDEPKTERIYIQALLHSSRVEVKYLTRPPQSWCYVEVQE